MCVCVAMSIFHFTIGGGGGVPVQGVGVHCAMGRGRTGTMLACYLVAKEGYSGDAAIEETRRRRRGSIETRLQEQAVRDFEDHLRLQKSSP